MQNKKLIIIILLFYYINISAQSSNELGAMAGVSYYLGEINHSTQFYSIQPAFGFLFRSNINDRYSVRVNAIRATLSGDDLDFNNGYQQTRKHAFLNNIYEISLNTEFNFLPYDHERNKLSPYVTGGIALLITPKADKTVTFSAPIGMGIKYSIFKRMTVGFEWIFRTTATDYLDLLEEPEDNTAGLKQITSINNNDWYVTAGFFVSWQFLGNYNRCSAYK